MAGRWIKRSIKRAARKGSVIGKRKKRGIINKAKRKAGDIAYKVGQTKPVRKTIKKIEDFSAVDALDRTIERSGIRRGIKKIEDFSAVDALDRTIERSGIRRGIKKIEDFRAVDALDRTIERSGIRKILNPKKRKKKPSKYKKPSNWPER